MNEVPVSRYANRLGTSLFFVPNPALSNGSAQSFSAFADTDEYFKSPLNLAVFGAPKLISPVFAPSDARLMLTPNMLDFNNFDVARDWMKFGCSAVI